MNSTKEQGSKSLLFGGSHLSLVNDKPYQYKDINTHKVSLRYEDCESGQDNKKALLDGKKCMLFISVGQAYHEAGKMFATIETLNRYNLKRCDIVLADTLQRHNYVDMFSSRQLAHEYAAKAGDAWLSRNRIAIENLDHPYSLSRWDEWLDHHSYDDYLMQIKNLYEKHQAYRAALDTNVNSYLERLQTINPNSDLNLLFQCGVRYLIEEMPIVMPIWAEMGYDFIFYPKPLTPGMAITKQFFVDSKSLNKCNWMYMRFKKKRLHQNEMLQEQVAI